MDIETDINNIIKENKSQRFILEYNETTDVTRKQQLKTIIDTFQNVKEDICKDKTENEYNKKWAYLHIQCQEFKLKEYSKKTNFDITKLMTEYINIKKKVPSKLVVYEYPSIIKINI